MSRREKTFDAVAMMRSIRDRISAEIQGMTLEQELAWLASQDIQDPFLTRLRDKAAQAAPADGASPPGTFADSGRQSGSPGPVSK